MMYEFTHKFKFNHYLIIPFWVLGYESDPQSEAQFTVANLVLNGQNFLLHEFTFFFFKKLAINSVINYPTSAHQKLDILLQ